MGKPALLGCHKLGNYSIPLLDDQQFHAFHSLNPNRNSCLPRVYGNICNMAVVTYNYNFSSGFRGRRARSNRGLIKAPLILEFLEPLMNDVNARLYMNIKQPTRRKH
ncbi:hypothetical protein SADUNF_Sadunf06G0038900 [Salix dunnii]|uniref:Uncharacterized protein n=1 Tax=Salix dunnii TaxID=1413687 RepID=A0A835MUS5_9ROSI|nr:hypothetical protein SADUNF_Sadunf06G0038900 [Salix dunnii]